ncbi:hypothetical protein CCR75_005272 [Bremia lactucae]|uniref:Uncharacterized protein n=1 Tax=Bremia lactucae TaxID=4779 RepID=A0A976FLI0_BRELC|nr:hypothetical protein CCR75_005272 [Bremia lactucae]
MRGRDEHAAVICTSVGNVEWKLSPSSAVLRLAWRPTICIDELLLAAASSDSSVRVFAVDI